MSCPSSTNDLRAECTVNLHSAPVALSTSLQCTGLQLQTRGQAVAAQGVRQLHYQPCGGVDHILEHLQNHRCLRHQFGPAEGQQHDGAMQPACPDAQRRAAAHSRGFCQPVPLASTANVIQCLQRGRFNLLACLIGGGKQRFCMRRVRYSP